MGVSNDLSWHFLFLSVFYPAHSPSHMRGWILADATGNSLRGCLSSLTPISPYPFLWLGFHLDCNIHPCPSGFLLDFANGWLRQKEEKQNKQKEIRIFISGLSFCLTQWSVRAMIWMQLLPQGLISTASALTESSKHWRHHSPHTSLPGVGMAL